MLESAIRCASQNVGWRRRFDLRYLVPLTEVLWKPMIFPKMPANEVQSAGVEPTVVIVAPSGTLSRAACWSSRGIAKPKTRRHSPWAVKVPEDSRTPEQLVARSNEARQTTDEIFFMGVNREVVIWETDLERGRLRADVPGQMCC